ncbi:MAG: ATP-binding cassette domain-containing protein, partial [Nitrososphaerota archaeon]|nr:ATP-binding cassette domain-containing protein [Nitrososphaerota archaeon]
MKLEIKELHASVEGKEILKGVNLSVGQGETHALMGPNGSGKSNIIESIRWCLGEMSWKSLRAGSMTDVIFAGTAKRQPLSVAEVTLCFDNASNRLPVDYTEVMITRRLFKSGESAY